MPEECLKEAPLADRRQDAAGSTEDPDWPALQRVLDGDPEAYGEVVRRHEPRLRRLLVGIVLDRHLAEDVLQEAFLLAYRNLDRFRREARFETWLSRIAVREAVAAGAKWRTWWRREAPFESSEAMAQVIDEEAAANERGTVERDETLALLKKLPVNERSAFVLHLEGLAYDEIARALAHPIGTISTWIHRARERLKLLLPEERRAAERRSGRAAPESRGGASAPIESTRRTNR